MYKSIRSLSARQRRRRKQKMLLNAGHCRDRDHGSFFEMVSVDQQNTQVAGSCSTQEAANCALPVKPDHISIIFLYFRSGEPENFLYLQELRKPCRRMA